MLGKLIGISIVVAILMILFGGFISSSVPNYGWGILTIGIICAIIYAIIKIVVDVAKPALKVAML